MRNRNTKNPLWPDIGILLAHNDGPMVRGNGRLSNGQKTKAMSQPRRQFLVQLDAGLIRRIKILAIDRNVSASSLVQEALLAFLAAAADTAEAAPPEAGP